MARSLAPAVTQGQRDRVQGVQGEPGQQGVRPTSRAERGRIPSELSATPTPCWSPASPSHPRPRVHLKGGGACPPLTHSPFSLCCLSRCLDGSDEESERAVRAGLKQPGLALVPRSQRHTPIISSKSTPAGPPTARGPEGGCPRDQPTGRQGPGRCPHPPGDSAVTHSQEAAPPPILALAHSPGPSAPGPQPPAAPFRMTSLS